MTIGIAAIAEGGCQLILATDRMVTLSVPTPYQYESSDIEKAYVLAPNMMALPAGNAEKAAEVITAAIQRIQTEQLADFKDVAEIVRQQYVSYRQDYLVQTHLEPRALDLQTLYEYQQTLRAEMVQAIDSLLAQFDIGVEILIAGRDDLGCHISTLRHPGVLVSSDVTGFACIGSGATYAMCCLLGAGYTRTLPSKKVEQLLRQAKAEAEKAPGVGKQTEVYRVVQEVSDA